MNMTPKFAVEILTHEQKQLLIRQAHAQRAEAVRSLFGGLVSAIRRRVGARSSPLGRAAPGAARLPGAAGTQTA